MKCKLLCGNIMDGMGKKLADCLSHFEFETAYCNNSFASLLKELAENHYDGVIFFSMQKNNITKDFIRECRTKYTDLKIYPITTYCSDRFNAELVKAGATRCLTMPFYLYELCGEVINDFHSADDLAILPEIADFLYYKGFPNHIIGFYHLCCILEKAVMNPELLNKSIMKLYEMTGETMNASACHIERSLRVLSSAAFKKGVKINGSTTHSKLKNKELISALAKEYAEENGF